MRKADMATFVNYMEYKLNLTDAKIKDTTEDGYNTLKDFYFKEQEGYELTEGYTDFRKYVIRNR